MGAFCFGGEQEMSSSQLSIVAVTCEWQSGGSGVNVWLAGCLHGTRGALGR